MPTKTNDEFRPKSSRRKMLKITTGGSIGTLLAGCLGSGQGGSNNSSGEQGGAKGEKILIGGTLPLSGAYGALGKNMQRAMQLAVDLTNSQKNFGPKREVQIKFKDTETSPETGRRRAQEHIQNGADILAGSLSDATAGPVGKIAQQNNMVYINLGGSNQTTGSNCLPASFVSASSAYQQSHGAPRYVMEQGLGNSVYTLAADYSWGQSNQKVIEKVLAKQYDVEFLGNTFTQLGASDFSQAISEAKGSGADIVALIYFGGEHIKTAKAAEQFGLLDESVCVWPLTGLDEASQIDQSILSHDNFYAGSLWYHGFSKNSDDAKSFVEKFKKKHNSLPTGAGGCMFAGLRTTLDAVKAVGTTKGDPLRKELEGKQFAEQIWGEYQNTKFRACDHSLIFPTPTLKGKNPDEVSGKDYFDIVSVPDDPKIQSRACSQTGCTMPDNWST